MNNDVKFYKADMLKHQSFIRFKHRNKKLKAVNDKLKEENDHISQELATLKEQVDAVK
jgi:cell division protein FtsB